MPAKRYRKKPVEIEAIEYTGTNADEVKNWALVRVAARSDLKMRGFNPIEIPAVKMVTDLIYIHTAHGRVAAVPGSYILYGGVDFYPCDPDTFHKTYEVVEDETQGGA